MVLNFPDSPNTDDQYIDSNSVIWVCTSTSPNIWEKQIDLTAYQVDGGLSNSVYEINQIINGGTA